MIKIGRFQFKTEIEFFQYTMEKYFRKVPPIPTNIYLNLNESKNITTRIKLAKICHFPSIINILYRDDNESVRKTVEQNDFWILIGQLQDVLGFEKKERRQFARSEVSRILFVMLMFEDDVDIICEVLRNPSISIKMITIYIKLLKKRGRGKKDEHILIEATKVLKEKKTRILKAAEINKASKKLMEKKSIDLLIFYLADNDHVVRKAVKNILIDSDPTFLSAAIDKAINGIENSSNYNQFIYLSEILQVARKRDNLKRASIEYLNLPTVKLQGIRYHSIADYFFQVLGRKKRLIVKSCLDDLTDFDNILILTHGHCDMDSEIIQLSASILSMNDIFILVKDISTPQKVFRSILNILAENADEEIQKTVEKIYEDESKRLWNRLKELETMLQACFEVVFQSLGFVEINQYMGAFKSLDESDRFLQKFWYKFSPSLQRKLKATQPIYKEVKKTFEKAISSIEADVLPSRLMELEHVQNMIEQIIELRNFDIEGLRKGAVENLDEELLKKTRRIWQSALSQYLGRIKSLNEMLKVKFKKMAPDVTDKTVLLENDFKEVFNEIEDMHKNKVYCSLPHPCQVCIRRGCAAERFLTEVHFILQELLDNFVEE